MAQSQKATTIMDFLREKHKETKGIKQLWLTDLIVLTTMVTNNLEVLPFAILIHLH